MQFQNSLLPLLVVLLFGGTTARQHYRGRLPNGNKVPCPNAPGVKCDSALCPGVGHMSCLGGFDDPRLNDFGKEFVSTLEWTAEFCAADSDGDGQTNGYELGDPCCAWFPGAQVPIWMSQWKASHPGFNTSTTNATLPAGVSCETFVLEESNFFQDGEEQVVLEYILDRNVIPARDTVYMHHRFNYPEDRQLTLVGAEPIIDNVELVHHFVMYGCEETISESEVGVGVPQEESYMQEECFQTQYVWAPGADIWVAPENTGFNIGANTTSRGFYLEVHYDNPKLLAGEADVSGVRLYLTSSPRQHELKVLWGGGSILTGPLIPGQEQYYSAASCQVEINPNVTEGPYMVTFFPHMHLLGRQLWSEQWRENNVTGQLDKVNDLGRDMTWSFDDQYWGPLDSIVLQDGDHISTVCMYDTRERNFTTYGGYGTFDEMCINFIIFWPAEAISNVFCPDFGQAEIYYGATEKENITSYRDLSSEFSQRVVTAYEAAQLGAVNCTEEETSTLGNLQSDAELLNALTPYCGEAETSKLQNTTASFTYFECSDKCAEGVLKILPCTTDFQSQNPDNVTDAANSYWDLFEDLQRFCQLEIWKIMEPLVEITDKERFAISPQKSAD